ncbi:hypothetical protein SYNPS1DRAFT_30135 [Syncephalis pseudoplumigaleata]|uniref:Uncharacterized protein n=1 Tax=Syncephalis pseudoplumigaleata TaxID=1712513 RepID=A0A4P9YXP5_9FUNG|nr:hypothetical protein SYNPS1DRAFT_30135 [Syncephalis pseudoplumigaleata]|eukprot:RKP24101.1 hypothetical protein SYNPS1DRAFT_30135 [Syncephalis pseudoplumigaleata]
MLDLLYDYQQAPTAIEAGHKAAGDDELDALDLAVIDHHSVHGRHRRRQQQQQQTSLLSSFGHRLHAFRAWLQDHLGHAPSHADEHVARQQQSPSSPAHRYSRASNPHPADITREEAESNMEEAIEHVQSNEPSHDTLAMVTLRELTMPRPSRPAEEARRDNGALRSKL